jgi:hypothetical protein
MGEQKTQYDQHAACSGMTDISRLRGYRDCRYCEGFNLLPSSNPLDGAGQPAGSLPSSGKVGARHLGADIVVDPVHIPGCPVEQPLHPIRRAIPGGLGQGAPVLAGQRN